MSQPRILLSTPNVAYEQRLRQVFGELNGELQRMGKTTDPDEVTANANVSGADVLALGPDFPVDDALALASVLDCQRPDLSVVLVTDASPELYQRALRAGVRDLLAPDALDAEVREVFERAAQVACDRRASLKVDAPPGTGSRIITVLSPKGGSGKTTVATNLSVGLAQVVSGEVVLVDLDVQFGDAVSGLGLVPEHTMLDVARAVKGLDALTLKVFLTPHSSDLYTLCAPDSPAEGEEVTVEQVGRIFELLASQFAYVVVDTAAGIGEHALMAAERATDLVLVSSMDVPSVRGLRKEVAALDQLGMTHQTRHFVLNRTDMRVGLDVGDIEATVGLTVDVEVPTSRAVLLSVNQGVPVIDADPRSTAARQLQQLIGRFVERPQQMNDETSGDGSWLSWPWKDRT